ncbi:leucine-rich repeat-containing protein 71-like isoform X2 [Cephus cinctus]|uniref:Leucine-rich repeat-containing protein 71-like isoform X2 n=1 Tax=Cephus cinctus TaxID=211228 RepID=A0AAJ7RUX8_CEPCN|nr:leucine-rich repeat-containing protein 71-like isoform X2 [Cephus cinctus]
MSEKKHRRQTIKEFNNLQIADTNFVSEFLEFCREANVSPLPKFRVMSPDNKVSMQSIHSSRTITSSSERENQFTKFEEKHATPIFRVTYENTKKSENPQKLECKGFEITICTLDALNLTMKNYSTITTLELPNCQINAYGIVQISEMLTEIGCIKDLNLDRNPNIKENYYLLCTPTNNLLYLSLRSCKISDEGIQKITKELEYRDPPDNPKLIALNLANNNISQSGAEYIALMLRTNRSLRSLILTGNRICDGGAASIIQELVMYTYHHSKMILKEVEWL